MLRNEHLLYVLAVLKIHVWLLVAEEFDWCDVQVVFLYLELFKNVASLIQVHVGKPHRLYRLRAPFYNLYYLLKLFINKYRLLEI